MRFRSRLVVNLDHFKNNIKQIRKISPGAQILCMVKADAYGHGMIPIARYAMTELGIKEFGCATLSEAVKLREELNELEFDIYVFSDIQLELLENADIYLKRRIIPVISNVSELDYILHTTEFKYFPICLKFNTGMNRLGLDPKDTSLIVNKLKQHHRTSVHHLISHYANASSEMESHPVNILQRKRFSEIKKFFRDSGITLERTSQSNSGTIEQKVGLPEEGDDTHVRPGLMLYGPSSLSAEMKSAFLGQLVSTLETYILRVFEVNKGDVVGYNSTPCPEDGVIAILAIGYGDGFFNRYSGAHLYHKGFEGVIIGRVSMDMTHVFFPKESVNVIKAHEIFTIWGQQEGDLLKFCNETKIIPYEVFCALLPRVPRVYRLN
ncbi:MAG: alanine racemase [Bacteriovoracaceae bacterium]|nr:alanine racemase [Bacteriovoracaceae bacterium]